MELDVRKLFMSREDEKRKQTATRMKIKKEENTCNI